MQNSLGRFKNLSVIYLNIEGDIELLAKRAMTLQCNISDFELTIIDNDNSVVVKEERWK
jgi:uncharacterized protein YaeQ